MLPHPIINEKWQAPIMTSILLHQWAFSPFCGKVRRILEHKGLDYEVKNYNGLLALQVPKLSSAGKLPVLDIDGERIQDSRRIAAALEQRFPDKPLVPGDPQARAQMEILQDWADESLYWYEVFFRGFYDRAWGLLLDSLTAGRPVWEKPMLNVVARNQFRQKLRAQGIGRQDKASVEERFRLLLQSLDTQLRGRDWLIGTDKTLADIAVASQLHEILRTGHLAQDFAAAQEVSRWLQTV